MVFFRKNHTDNEFLFYIAHILNGMGLNVICITLIILGGDNIRIGFIGAGKVGFSLGKYFTDKGIKVSGYYSKHCESAKEAAEFTDSKFFMKLDDLIRESDIIFITTPDKIIKSIWDSIDKKAIKNKILCHCSGSLSSKIFSNIENYNSYGYSIHPMFAFSDKYNSYKDLKNAFITIEGSLGKMKEIKGLLKIVGNDYKVISDADKSRYHLASALVSNHVLAIINQGINELKKCGFSDEEASKSLYPLVSNNIKNIFNNGIINSLTGPVERADEVTLERHLDCLNEEDKILYKMLSKKLIDIAEKKNTERDYKKIKLMMGE